MSTHRVMVRRTHGLSSGTPGGRAAVSLRVIDRDKMADVSLTK